MSPEADVTGWRACRAGGYGHRAVRYVVICLHCGSRVTTTDRVGDPEVVAVEDHLRTDHPDTLPVGRRLDFADMVGHHVRLTMG